MSFKYDTAVVPSSVLFLFLLGILASVTAAPLLTDPLPAAVTISPIYAVRRHPVGLILPVLLFGGMLLGVIVTFFYEMKVDGRLSKSLGPERLPMMTLCHDENAEYEYSFVLRIGCPTENFNMKTGHLDVSILGPDDCEQGPTVRFKCARLTDRICGEMIIEIERMLPLQPITGLRLGHSENGFIYLYETILIDSSSSSIIETRHFNTYLGSTGVYRGKVFHGGADSEDGYFPELPVLEWTLLEMLVISFFLIMVAGNIVFLCEYFDLYPLDEKQDGSFYRSLLDVLFTLPLTMPLLASVTILYKYYFKRSVTTQEYQLKPSSFSWRFICKLFLCILFFVSLALFGPFVTLGLAVSFTKSVYWWCSTLITSAIILGTWASANKWQWLKDLLEQDGSQPLTEGHIRQSTSLEAALASVSEEGDLNQNTTIGFADETALLGPKRASHTADNNLSFFGPKMYNPKSKLKVKSHTKKVKAAPVTGVAKKKTTTTDIRPPKGNLKVQPAKRLATSKDRIKKKRK